MVNVVVEEEEKRSITASRLTMKTQAGEQGAITGMLFLFDAEDPTADGFLDQFSQYDSWTAEDFRTALKERYICGCMPNSSQGGNKGGVEEGEGSGNE